MQFDVREVKSPSVGLVVITADPSDTEIRIGPGSPADGRSVRVDSGLPVFLEKGVNILNLEASNADVFARSGLFLQSLHAKNYTGDGDLYVLFRMSVDGNLRLSGELKGERHFPYEIQGDLICIGVDVDGHVHVGGNACISWENTRSFNVAGLRTCFDALRSSGQVVLARPGVSFSGPEVLDDVRKDVSDVFLARCVAALNHNQLEYVAAGSGVPFARAVHIAEAATQTATRAQGDKDAFLETPLAEQILNLVISADADIQQIREAERVLLALFNAALGTDTSLEHLAPGRAEQVRRYDSALHFLSVFQDPEERHYFVEDAREALETSFEFETEDDLDAAIYDLVSALADPACVTEEEALRVAAAANPKIAAVQEEILSVLREPPVPDPSPGL